MAVDTSQIDWRLLRFRSHYITILQSAKLNKWCAPTFGYNAGTSHPDGLPEARDALAMVSKGFSAEQVHRRAQRPS